MNKEIIARGAEAVLYRNGDIVLKERLEKPYRHKYIDNSLRKSRTRREAKILTKLQELNFPSPILSKICDKTMQIEMSFIDGDKLRDVFENDPVKFGKEIGVLVGTLHKNDIIHADLTTSNMILTDKGISLIDFGLSLFSIKQEDKAVDLHLLSRAILSKHSSVYEIAWDAIIKGYEKVNPDSKSVLSRLSKVEQRGRNKAKVDKS